MVNGKRKAEKYKLNVQSILGCFVSVHLPVLQRFSCRSEEDFDFKII